MKTYDCGCSEWREGDYGHRETVHVLCGVQHRRFSEQCGCWVEKYPSGCESLYHCDTHCPRVKHGEEKCWCLVYGLPRPLTEYEKLNPLNWRMIERGYR